VAAVAAAGLDVAGVVLAAGVTPVAGVVAACSSKLFKNCLNDNISLFI
jgi:hypothetical protein